MNEEQRKEFVKGWNMLSRPANDPEFVEIRKTLADAFGELPVKVQYQFMNIQNPQGGAEIKFFAEQCGLYASEETKEKLLKINYVIFNMTISMFYRVLQEVKKKGLIAPE